MLGDVKDQRGEPEIVFGVSLFAEAVAYPAGRSGWHGAGGVCEVERNEPSEGKTPAAQAA
jgi:hypothetical protein